MNAAAWSFDIFALDKDGARPPARASALEAASERPRRCSLERTRRGARPSSARLMQRAVRAVLPCVRRGPYTHRRTWCRAAFLSGGLRTTFHFARVPCADLSASPPRAALEGLVEHLFERCASKRLAAPARGCASPPAASSPTRPVLTRASCSAATAPAWLTAAAWTDRRCAPSSPPLAPRTPTTVRVA